MKQITVKRFLDDGNQTLGTLTLMLKAELFVCKTLELPWKDNHNDISCIPKGAYLCKWTRSTRLSDKAGHDVFTYEITGVPGRAGIRIHSANYYYQLLGCIALGDAHKDINSDGELDAIHSGDTVGKFNTYLNEEDFMLTIS